MHTKKIGQNLYAIDLETGGLANLICSYVIKGKKTVLVESGPTNSIPNLLSGLKELDISLQDVRYVALTHIHLDHGGGAGTLLKSLPKAKVIVHPKGMPHLIDPEKLWPSAKSVLGFISDIFGKPEPVPPNRIIPITEGAFDLDDSGQFLVTETSGHASHNLSFHESFNNGIFPGDAAGTYLAKYGVVVPTTPPPFFLEAALASLDKLIKLNPSVLYFSHFGKAENAVKRLEDYKVQLQLWADIAEDGVKNNQSFEEITQRIISEDKVMSQLIDFIRNHRIYSVTVLHNCIQGFIDYAKRKQAK